MDRHRWTPIEENTFICAKHDAYKEDKRQKKIQVGRKHASHTR